MFYGQATQPRPGEALGLTLDVRRFAEHTSDDGCRLVWTFLDANGPTPVADPSLVNQRARDVDGDPMSCGTLTRIWVPRSVGLDGYDRIRVRVELWDGDRFLGAGSSEEVTLG
jgi:hypothetical protein